MAAATPDGLIFQHPHFSISVPVAPKHTEGYQPAPILKVKDLSGNTYSHVASQRIQIAYNFFRSQGQTPAQACASIGNFLWEDPNLEPAQAQIGGGPGMGIAQWSVGGRWDDLVKWAAKQGLKPEELLTQLKFVWAEETNRVPGDPFAATLDALKAVKASNPNATSQLTAAFMNSYESPNPALAALSNRVQLALNVFTVYGHY
jgi:hypothetical protein